jgi:ADP-ribosylglycohydrolase
MFGREVKGPALLWLPGLGAWGMVSDDTDHADLTASALLECPDDPAGFARSLGRKLRWWLAGLPAGVGLATARAILKLWLGWPAERSGVFSAGNGPAMRSALLGVCLGGDPAGSAGLAAFVRACTRLTHTDPRAERAALLVAVAARAGSVGGPSSAEPGTVERAAAESGLDLAEDAELAAVWTRMREHLAARSSPRDFADAMGRQRGVSGYAYHTVPAALYCWMSFPDDPRRAVAEAVGLGGDADTVGAVTGALAGATCGAEALPADWLSAIIDRPRGVSRLRSLAERLSEHFAEGRPARPLPLSWPSRAMVPLRNAAFLAVVLAHGLRRLLPPY